MYDSEKTRVLNDAFRKTLSGGRVLVTAGISAREDVATILEQVREYNDFSEDDDPYGEHDFGAIRHGDQQIFWKIDYYNCNMQEGSPDPGDSTVTTRVITIMFASE